LDEAPQPYQTTTTVLADQPCTSPVGGCSGN